eukprot:37897-Chlamydomonas_euryale.AAC.25
MNEQDWQSCVTSTDMCCTTGGGPGWIWREREAVGPRVSSSKAPCGPTAGCAAPCRPVNAWPAVALWCGSRACRTTTPECRWEVFSDLASRRGQESIARAGAILPAHRDFVNIVGACLRVPSCLHSPQLAFGLHVWRQVRRCQNNAVEYLPLAAWCVCIRNIRGAVSEDTKLDAFGAKSTCARFTRPAAAATARPRVNQKRTYAA